jgi:hypothetical protein
MGLKIEEACRKYGISHPTYYNWKAKYGGMTIPEVKRLRALEKENQQLKKLVADLSLDVVASQARRACSLMLIEEHRLSERRACRLEGAHRATVR